jgi:hypothetical protein
VDSIHHDVVTEAAGQLASRKTFARGYDGGRSMALPEVVPGTYTLTFDQEAATAGELLVEVRAAAKGCA